MELLQKAQIFRETIEKVKTLRKEQDKLFDQLMFYVQLWEQNINHENVIKYEYNPRYDKRPRHLQFEDCHIINEVEFKDGTKKRIEAIKCM